MTHPEKAKNLSGEAKEVQAAVEHGENIRDAVHNITLASLKRGKLP